MTGKIRIWAILLVWGWAAFLQAVRGSDLQELKGCILVPTEWADGDSFLIRVPGGKELTLRLYGVDCIEWHVSDASDERRLRAQRRYFGISEVGGGVRESIDLAKRFGEKAAKAVRLSLREPFTVYTAMSDARGDGRFQRFYGFVVTSQGKDLGAELVEMGLARAYGVSRETYDGRTRDEYRSFLADVELQAAAARVGIWGETNWEKLPQERRAQRVEDEEVAIALGGGGLRAGELVNPNTSARDELMRLPGIGEVLANRIIEGRPYAKASDLLEVPGVGEKKLENFKEFLIFPDEG